MSSDPGLALISALKESLQIEPDWCVPLDRGVHWWPGHLAQRIWADPIRHLRTHSYSRVHIESDFLRDTTDAERMLQFASLANRMTTVSAVVFRPYEQHIRLHASVCASEDNLGEALRLATIIASVQAADASAKSLGFAEVLKAQLDHSAHPTSGTRSSGHMTLLTLQALAEENQDSSPAADIDFKPLEDLDPRPWLMAFAGKGGLTAEMSFTSDTPAMMAVAGVEGAEFGTALLQLTTDFKHPQLGDGVLIRLTLPLTVTAEWTNSLNLLEAHDGAGMADHVGGWCLNDDSPLFVAFFPTCLAERDWLVNAIYDNVIRTQWAKALLVKSAGA